ncbi:NUDIX domain-containing protein [Amycolatopsis umgeniensis]|uniref:8-oxo-dGTP diphosphatase n=1 Tax=Amycolatopsis umgeniensis TaxID=336628 RepID=A0A841B1Z8_9PSEU|nr:NUDIX domain-containing protein [Amycolatopsis umgeniensis]MBB5852514.1 8-oxo-dGTP diphosphatase [Amycolatopsis umgeniensis]
MSLRHWVAAMAVRIATRLDRRAPVFYAADVVLFAHHDGVPHVLLIERGKNPHQGKAAFPGGHVESWETSLEAAKREAVEETGLDLDRVPLRLVGVYDAPGRDPRGRYVGAAYTAVLSTMPAPVAADDAAAAHWVPLARAVKAAQDGGFAFDHADILTDAVRATGVGR